MTRTSREATWTERYARAAMGAKPQAKQLLNLKQTCGLLTSEITPLLVFNREKDTQGTCAGWSWD